MRDVQHIWDAWKSGGPFIGEYKPSTRVTVEADYWLRLSHKAPPVVNPPWYDCAFDDDSWDFAADYCSQTQASVTGIGTWNPPAGPSGTAFAGLGGWPNGSDRIIGPSAGDPSSAPVGTCYFRSPEINVVGGAYTLWVCADNIIDLWLDGTQIHHAEEFRIAQSLPITLTPGVHCIAAKVRNAAQPPPLPPDSYNPIGLLVALWTAFGTPTEVMSTDATWKIMEYPPGDPADTTPHGELVGTWKNGPARWFQRADASLTVETEIPNVVQVDTNKSIHNDAQTATITMTNTVTDEPGEIPEMEGQFGKPGFYTWTRGESQESKARWGHNTNDWNNVLVPNALIRTYQGYGGTDLTVEEAVAAGNLVCTGTWLVDEVKIGTTGDLVMSCRDMGKLLVDQQLFPPLVPKTLYPLKYYRYTYENFTIPPVKAPGPQHDLIPVIMRYKATSDPSAPYNTIPTTSSSDVAAGAWNAGVYGHRPTDAFDAGFVKNDPRFAGASMTSHNPYDQTTTYKETRVDDTFWLSDAPSDDTVYIEIACDGQEVNRVHVTPVGGNYMCYVSVMESGRWVHPEGAGLQPGGWISASTDDKRVPWLWKEGIPWEQDVEMFLPRTYRADKVRLTFKNLIATGAAPGNRAAIRQIGLLMDQTHAHLHFGETVDSLCFTAAPFPHIDAENHVGYWQGRDDGEVFAFGDCRSHPPAASNPVNVLDGRLIEIAPTPTGQGYYRLDQFGRVVAHGDAVWHGDCFALQRTDYSSMTVNPAGDGYWLIRRDGVVQAFGAANTGLGDGTTHISLPWIAADHASPENYAIRIRSHPTGDGYWILFAGGQVEGHGACSTYGDSIRPGYSQTEVATDFRYTRDGAGYWILSGGGIVEAFGDATPIGNLGNGKRYTVDKWVEGLCWSMVPSVETDAGYGIFHADGTIDQMGDFDMMGSIAAHGGQIRKDGNYKDYLDIIKELLLWAGFYLYRDPQPATFPDIAGLLETTGSFSTEDLPADMFDKVPVIQPITGLKEAVGYVFYVDDEGGARFQSPNWWSLGNYGYDGNPIDIMPEIDERVQLTQYSIAFNDTNARSEIIIANENPNPTLAGQPALTDGLTVTRHIPPSEADLKGMVKPAMWTNGMFADEKEQKAMAELIGMHIWFSRRTGNVTMQANPLIGIDDQVRIYERQTGETFVHYVSDVSTSHDLRSGSFTQTLGTYWLGGTPYNENAGYYSAAPLPGDAGYWMLSSFGDVYAFGNATLYAKNDVDTHILPAIAIRSTFTGDGYWTLDSSGKIISYGGAVNYGKLATTDVVDMAVTWTGAGYWLLRANGTVTPFGDAATHPSGAHAPAVAIETSPYEDGYWILYEDGVVEALGGITDYGGYTGPTLAVGSTATSIRRTNTGAGYWITFKNGVIEAHGDAVDLGGLDYSADVLAHAAADKTHDGVLWDILPDYSVSATDYSLLVADGTLFYLGSFPALGFAGGGNGGGQFQWIFTTETHASNINPNGGSLGGNNSNNNNYKNGGGNTRPVLPVSPELMNLLKRGGSKSAKNAVAAKFQQPTNVTMRG